MDIRALPARPRPRRRLRMPAQIGRIVLAGLTLTFVALLAAAAAGRVRLHATRALPLPPARADGLVSPTTPTTQAVDYVAGVFRNATGRWAVGAAGDIVAVGDWDCDGATTLALLRPTTGAVYAFVSWAGADRDEAADALGIVDGATGLESADVDGDGCDDLVVQRAVGPPVTLHPPDHL